MNLWQEMGLTGKRVVIVHHDDIGITEAQNRAYLELGFPTASVLMPASWAPQVRQGDLGVHLTLTSEWKAPRIRPLTTGKSLRDPEGFFWPSLEEAWAHVDTDEAEAELRAQIDAFYALGMEPTHIDTHMGSILRPDLAAIYLKLALEYRLPCMLEADPEALPVPDAIKEVMQALIEQSPIPGVRHWDGYNVPAAERRDWYLQQLRSLGPGVYHFIHHAAVDTPEGRRLPDWEGRMADYESLKDPEIKQALGEFVLLTYREVRDALRRYL